MPPSFSQKNPFIHSKVLRRIPFPRIGSYQKPLKPGGNLNLNFSHGLQQGISYSIFVESSTWWHAHASFPSALYYRYSQSPYFFMCRRVSRYTPPPPRSPHTLAVSQDDVRSMLLVSQLRLPSRSYRALGGIAATLSQIAVKSASPSQKSAPKEPC